jgi:hypothetical protein
MALVTVMVGIAAVGPVVAEEASATLSCDALAGVDRLPLEPGTILFFGEMHGTAEAPALVADVACWALRRGASLRVGLEMPHQETAATEVYLASAGGEEDRERLLAGPFWQREYQDGRSSEAIADLIEELRRLKAAGQPVTVTLFDSSESADSGQERDREMAKRLTQAARSHPSDVLLVLSGNLHARLKPGNQVDSNYKPLGYLVRQALPDRTILALDFTSAGGSAWICISAEPKDCQAIELRGQGDEGERRLTLFEHPDVKGFDGSYYVGAMSASPPAVPQAPAPEPPAKTTEPDQP